VISRLAPRSLGSSSSRRHSAAFPGSDCCAGWSVGGFRCGIACLSAVAVPSGRVAHANAEMASASSLRMSKILLSFVI
jgi:hypothetical protein